MELKSNIVLIGMPSSGKTTVSKILSNDIGMEYLDTDKEYVRIFGETPQQTVAKDGRDEFLKKQNELLKNLDMKETVISTGGAVIYNKEGMENIKKMAIVFFLKTSYEIIEKRVSEKRKLTKGNGQSLHDIYMERLTLYRDFSDYIIDCDGKNPDQVTNALKEKIDFLKGR